MNKVLIKNIMITRDHLHRLAQLSSDGQTVATLYHAADLLRAEAERLAGGLGPAIDIRDEDGIAELA